MFGKQMFGGGVQRQGDTMDSNPWVSPSHGPCAFADLSVMALFQERVFYLNSLGSWGAGEGTGKMRDFLSHFKRESPLS